MRGNHVRLLRASKSPIRLTGTGARHCPHCPGGRIRFNLDTGVQKPFANAGLARDEDDLSIAGMRSQPLGAELSIASPIAVG